MGPGTEEDEREFHSSTNPRQLYSSSTSTSITTLTSTSSDDEVFNPLPETPRIKNTNLQRNGAFRRPPLRRPRAANTLPQPTSPSQVVTWQVQNLEQVLLRHRPLVPEVVPLGPGVVNLSNVLDAQPGPSSRRRGPLSPVQQLLESPGPVLRSAVQQLESETDPAAPASDTNARNLRNRPRIDYKKMHEGHM